MTEDWVTYFSALAGATGTVFSILFVTFSISASYWRSHLLKELAGATILAELFVPLLEALIALMPNHPWKIGAVIGGTLGLGVKATHIWWYRKMAGSADAFDRGHAFFGTAISVPLYTGFVAAALIGAPIGLYVTASISLWLIMSGAFQAWRLLR